MFKISHEIRQKLLGIILCMIVVALFVGESNDNKIFIPGENLKWFHARAILSISMIIFFVFTFIVTDVLKIFKNFLHRKDMLILSMVLVSLFIGFFNSDNYSYIFQRIQIKLPFLILPLCASSFIISRKEFHRILFAFLLMTFFTSIYTFINYIIYFDHINASYLQSKVMPSPINHVRFSILSALATYTSYYLFKQNIKLFRFERIVVLTIGVFLFIFTHIYSVRSGIIALYAMMFLEILVYIFKYKSYKKGFITFITIIISGILMFIFSPSLKNKMINTKQDIAVLQNNGNANYNSLATRFVSYEIAIDLFKENIILGCGLGDLEIKNTKLFNEKYPEIVTPIIPHNEFLYYLASMGLLGIITFSISFFFPLFYKRNYKNEFLLMIYVTLFFSFMTEPMIENQLGVACSIVFIMLPLMVKEDERFDY